PGRADPGIEVLPHRRGGSRADPEAAGVGRGARNEPDSAEGGGASGAGCRRQAGWGPGAVRWVLLSWNQRSRTDAGLADTILTLPRLRAKHHATRRLPPGIANAASGRQG